MIFSPGTSRGLAVEQNSRHQFGTISPSLKCRVLVVYPAWLCMVRAGQASRWKMGLWRFLWGGESQADGSEEAEM